MRKPIVFFVVLLVTLSPTPAPALLLNLSTRVEIPPPALGEDVTSLIGGFIIGGNSGRKILIRALGPSLADFGLIPLADPTLELHDATGAIIATNDNWMDTQEADILDTGLAPTDAFESAILMVLLPVPTPPLFRAIISAPAPPVARPSSKSRYQPDRCGSGDFTEETVPIESAASEVCRGVVGGFFLP